MNVDIEYNQKTVIIEIPDRNLLDVIAPDNAEKPITVDTFQERLVETDKDRSVKSFLEGIRERNEQILIIINDANRPTPSYVVLEALLPYLESMDARVSIATGSHKPPSEDELRQLLGGSYHVFRPNLHIHKCRDADAHSYLGTTSRGTPVVFDNIVRDAENILVIGSVEPHYFAGFTGGRKAFLPGHAGYETIEHNHSFSLREEASLLNLSDNPVHLDMTEACGFLGDKNIYSVQLVLDCCSNIGGAFGGDLYSSFTAGIPLCTEYFTKEIPELADVVLTVAEYPMDISLYQSQKAMENAKPALKENGILIFVSATRQGIGNSVFADLLSSSDDLDEIMGSIREKYVLGYQKTAKFVEAIRRYRMLLVTDIEPSVIRSLHMEPVPSIQEAVDMAIEAKGKEARVLVMPKGSALMPKLRVR